MKFLPALKIALGAVFLSLGFAQAQPNPNGTIADNEYNNEYNVGPGASGVNWRMTWDNTNLYVAVERVTNNQPVILYLDLDPQQFVSGVGSGAETGVSYNGVNGTLPFQADVVISVSSATREYRIWDRETGNSWKPAPSSFGGGYGDNNDTRPNRGIREFSIPWTSINPIAGQGRPANFNWMGYAVGSTGTIYGQAPKTIPAGDVGQTAHFSRYFTVLGSGTGSSGKAFGPDGVESYSHSNPAITQLPGTLTVYDFTLNTTSSLNRTGATSAWTVQGNLSVGKGTLTLGNSAANVTVSGDVNTGAGNVNVFQLGKISFLNSSANLFVNGNILFPDPTQFDITANVNLTGNSVNRAISGGKYAKLTLSGNSTTTINNSSLTITNTLNIDKGTLDTRPFQVDLGSSGILSETGGYLLGNVLSKKNMTNPNPYDFGGTGLILTSTPNTAAGQPFPGEVIAERITGSFGLASDREWAGAIKTIDRRFSVTATNPANIQNPVETEMKFTYIPKELQDNGVGKVALFQSPESKLNYKSVPNLDQTRDGSPGTKTVTAKGPLVLQGFFSLSDGTVPLPVELISFSGKAEKNGVSLIWATASELQNKGFEIEHSTEQSAWKSIGFVAGNGSSNERHAYSYFDRQARAGNNYYRLRQIDADGKSVYTSPIMAQMGAVAFSLSPVPATDVLTLNGLGSGKSTVEIYNARGQRVVSTSIQANATTTLSIGALPAGIYIVRVLGADRKTQTARFIKQ